MAIKYFVIDTNVFIAANRKAEHLCDEDIDKCRLFVTSLFSDTVISLDLQGEIFTEYMKYLNLSGQPDISDHYFKYIWDRQHNRKICEMVDISKNKKGIYKQLNNKNDLLKFDQNDQKFIAVCLGSKNQAKICNATDSDWKNNKTLLSKHNIEVLEVLQEPTP